MRAALGSMESSALAWVSDSLSRISRHTVSILSYLHLKVQLKKKGFTFSFP